MSRNLRSFAGFLLFLTLALGLASCSSFMGGKDDFSVRGNDLYRGDDTWTIRAFQSPELGAQGASLETMVPAMARVAEVGGNTICFDLAGFNADGTKLDRAGLRTVRNIAQRGKDQRMAVLVRVLGDSTDPVFRKKAVKTAAKVLDEGRAVYWIDGPDAAELAKVFKKKAKHFVVAAPANGDIKVIDVLPSEQPEELVLLVDALPDFEKVDVNFVMSGGDKDYSALDQALTRPEETAPWSPDNSVLSEAERLEGFVALFDGKTLDGWWAKEESEDCFQVTEYGFIEFLSGGCGALVSNKRYGDFVFRCDWKIMPGGNSGIWFRAPRDARQSKIGFELQMRGDSDVEEPGKDNSAAIYDVLPPTANALLPEGQWNAIEVLCDGPHLQVTLNGQVVQDVNVDEVEELKYRLRKGFICLTDHGDYIAFRNIRIKELS